MLYIYIILILLEKNRSLFCHAKFRYIFLRFYNLLYARILRNSSFFFSIKQYLFSNPNSVRKLCSFEYCEQMLIFFPANLTLL